jgi:hypothetical protein
VANFGHIDSLGCISLNNCDMDEPELIISLDLVMNLITYRQRPKEERRHQREVDKKSS